VTVTGFSLREPYLQYEFTVGSVRAPDGECSGFSALATKVCGDDTPLFLVRRTKDEYATDLDLGPNMLGPLLYPVLSEVDFLSSRIGVDPTTHDFTLGGFSCQDARGRRIGTEMIWLVQDGGIPLDAPRLAGMATWVDGQLDGYCAEYHPSGALASIRKYRTGRLDWYLYTVAPTNTALVACAPESSTRNVPLVELAGMEPEIGAISEMCDNYRRGRLDGLKIIPPYTNEP